MQHTLRHHPSNCAGRVCQRVPHRVANVRPSRTSRLSSAIALAAKGSKATSAKGFGAPKQQPGQKGIAADAPCPCGSGATYEACCARHHAAPAAVPTPEALLRSRYCAYAIKDPAFIVDTTHPDSPEFTGSRTTYSRAVKGTMQRMDPMGLTILSSAPPPERAAAAASSGGAAAAAGSSSGSPDEAFLTFRVRRRLRDPEAPRNPTEVDEVTERSRFVRVNGRWLFMDSDFPGDADGEATAAAAPAAPAAPAQAEAPKKKGFLPFFS